MGAPCAPSSAACACRTRRSEWCTRSTPWWLGGRTPACGECTDREATSRRSARAPRTCTPAARRARTPAPVAPARPAARTRRRGRGEKRRGRSCVRLARERPREVLAPPGVPPAPAPLEVAAQVVVRGALGGVGEHLRAAVVRACARCPLASPRSRTRLVRGAHGSERPRLAALVRVARPRGAAEGVAHVRCAGAA